MSPYTQAEQPPEPKSPQFGVIAERFYNIVAENRKLTEQLTDRLSGFSTPPVPMEASREVKNELPPEIKTMDESADNLAGSNRILHSLLNRLEI